MVLMCIFLLISVVDQLFACIIDHLDSLFSDYPSVCSESFTIFGLFVFSLSVCWSSLLLV